MALLTAVVPVVALVGELYTPRSDNLPRFAVLLAVFILAVGLWRRRRWAWWLGLPFAALWLLGLAATTMMVSRLGSPVPAADIEALYAFLALQAVLTLILVSLLLAPATRRDFFTPPA